MTGEDAVGAPIPWPTWCRRIVLVVPRYPEVSGGSRFIDNFADALEGIGVQCDVVTVFPGNARTRRDPAVLIPRERLHREPSVRSVSGMWRRVSRIPSWGFKKLDAVWNRRRARHLFHAYRADTAVVFTHVLALRAVHDLGVSVSSLASTVIGQHHSSFESLAHETWLREAIPDGFAAVDAVTVLSEGDAEKFRTIIDTPCFAVANMAASATLVRIAEPSPRPPIAVALTRLSEEKQLDVMIRAFDAATAGDSLVGWQLHIYGDGSQREPLSLLIKELDVTARIRLCGVSDDPASVLRSAAVNLLTSRYEGFGYSVLEAAQQAVPSVAFDCSPGLHDLMVAVQGTLVPVDAGEQAFTDALRRAFADKEALALQGRAAQLGASAYEPSRVLNRWREVLDVAHESATARLGRRATASTEI